MTTVVDESKVALKEIDVALDFLEGNIRAAHDMFGGLAESMERVSVPDTPRQPGDHPRPSVSAPLAEKIVEYGEEIGLLLGRMANCKYRLVL